ncbi:RNA methyltransferase [uncultured Dubosiella sp.]|uniref:RNA methyltransferase n=1 Tax=uncultured Dubosiella sp. TaxID=1937011 RepID=UPI00273077A0|nr:RNA methyltransferase [uncultured Dubosiella sp.]
MNKFYQGTISCKAILEAGKRKAGPLYVDPNKRTKDFSYIIHLAKKASVAVLQTPREKLDELTGSKTHGGMALEAEDLVIPSIETIGKKSGAVFYIEGLEDPYNLGSVCRTIYAAGANLLILPPRDWSNAYDTILKASAGAFEKLDIAYASEEQCVDYLRKHHIPLLCAHRKDAVPLATYDFPSTCCIAIGGAMRGLSKKILKHADENIYIQYGRDYRNALDTASSAAVFAFTKRNKEIEHEHQSR